MAIVPMPLIQSAPVVVTCRIETNEISYFGSFNNLQAGKPQHRSSKMDYIIDLGEPSVTSEANSTRSKISNNPAYGSSVRVEGDGIIATKSSVMPGGFEFRDSIHFKADGSSASSTRDLLSRGKLVRHSESVHVCSPRQ
jgi:hypothetical protein